VDSRPSSNWNVTPWKPASGEGRRAPPARGRPGWLHLVLFMLTVVTTTVAGVGLAHRPAPMPMWLAFSLLRYQPQRLLDGIAFSAPLLATLFAHEMGHYLVAHAWRMRASWPFFVPMPAGLGTMGALIQMDGDDNQDRRALLEIGAAGPLTGFVLAYAFLLLGLSFSDVKTADEMAQYVSLGGFVMPDSMGMSLGIWLVKGGLAPNTFVVLHPMALAGWYGLYLTWFNLLPFGQLDGGHISSAAWPRSGRWLSALVVVMNLALAAFTRSFSWLGVLLGLAILGVLAGIGHPTPSPAHRPGFRQHAVLVTCVLVFVLCFVTDPLPRSGL
jgi:membrane-associated protease RseP (regulator of RpoE activity)